MDGNAFCFLLGQNRRRLSFIERVVAVRGGKCRQISQYDESLAQRILGARSGCIVVDDASFGPTLPDASRNVRGEVAQFLLSYHMWLPVVILRDSEEPKQLGYGGGGAYATIHSSIGANELASLLERAIERDTHGRYAPATLRRAMQSLTRREQETIRLFLDGHNTKVVAKALDITHQTVDKHRGRALRKIGVRTVVELQNEFQKAMLTSFGVDLDNCLIPRVDATTTGLPVPPPHFSRPTATTAIG